jgi:hypothetical protein
VCCWPVCDLCSLVVGLVSLVIGLLFVCVVCRSVVLWCVLVCCFVLDVVDRVVPYCPQLFGLSCSLYGCIVVFVKLFIVVRVWQCVHLSHMFRAAGWFRSHNKHASVAIITACMKVT